MPAGKLGQGTGLNNTSRESHIGGPVDGSPIIISRRPSRSNWTPTIVLASAVLNGVAVETNHVTKILGRAGIMKRVNLRGGASGTPVWAEVITLCADNDPIDGKILTVDDDGRGTLGQVGMNMEFEVPSTYNLLKHNGLGSGNDVDADHHVGRRVIGAGDGMVKPMFLVGPLAGGASAAAIVIYLNDKRFWDMARGKITRVFPNGTTGGKVQVDMWVDGNVGL